MRYARARRRRERYGRAIQLVLLQAMLRYGNVASAANLAHANHRCADVPARVH